MWGKRADLSPAPPSADVRLEFAWNAYWAQENWSRNVDTKASIVLALETAAVGVVLAAINGNKSAIGLARWQWALAFAGLGLLLLAVLMAGLTIVPHIRRDPVRRHDLSERRIFWFGHLRQFDLEEIQNHLGALTNDVCLEILAREGRTVSRLIWMKCVRLRVSMLLGFGGAIVVTIPLWALFVTTPFP